MSTKMDASLLVAGVQTALPASGIGVGEAGTYSLNICNDSDQEISFTAIYVTDGSTPSNANKIRPAFSVEAKGWHLVQPIALGEGLRVLVEADAACTVQLIGKKEG